MCSKQRGMMPLRSSSPATPSIEKVLPVPVCPYAKTVPLKPVSTWVTMGLHVPSYTSTCRESQLYTPSNVYSFGGSLTAGFCSRIWPDEVFISTMRSRPACFSVLFIGRHRSTTLTHSSELADAAGDAEVSVW